MPYCTTCGSEVAEDMLFCHQCGRKLRVPDAVFEVDRIRDYDAQVEEPENTLRGRRKKGKLYKQWVSHAGLPAEEILPARPLGNMPVSGERDSRRLALLQVSLGMCIGIVGTALVFLLV